MTVQTEVVLQNIRPVSDLVVPRIEVAQITFGLGHISLRSERR